MRSAILIAAFCLCDSINKDWLEDKYVGFMAIVLIVALFMDVCDFIKNLIRK